MAKTPASLGRLPRSVWALGIVSLFMDLSSEMIHGLLPVFLVTSLGASAAAVGVIDGIAEATASITKVFSGWLSDRLGNRKWLAVAGYGMSALTKPLFPLAGGVTAVLSARFFDRIGKGVRGAPRDALIADVTADHTRGAAYGLRQSLDTVGAFAGPLIAIGLMWLLADNIRAVFWFAIIPAVICVLVLIFAVKEPPKAEGAKRPPPIRWRDLKMFGPAFWSVVIVGGVFTLARFSEAFLILRAQDEGLPIALAPAVLVLMNVVYAASAAPFGRLSDRVDRRLLLGAGLIVLIAADLTLAGASGLAAAMVGVALWGLHMGLTQGILSAMVADTAPAEARGTAFGLFNLVRGGLLLIASVLAGELWTRIGPNATFLAGAGFAALAGLGVIAVLRRGVNGVAA